MLVDIDGNVLKTLREEKNVSQEALAELLKCKRQTISNIETGKSKKTDDQNLYTLAKYFDIAPDQLRGLEDTPQEKSFTGDRQVLSDFVSRLHLKVLDNGIIEQLKTQGPTYNKTPPLETMGGVFAYMGKLRWIRYGQGRIVLSMALPRALLDILSRG